LKILEIYINSIIGNTKQENTFDRQNEIKFLIVKLVSDILT